MQLAHILTFFALTLVLAALAAMQVARPVSIDQVKTVDSVVSPRFHTCVLTVARPHGADYLTTTVRSFVEIMKPASAYPLTIYVMHPAASRTAHPTPFRLFDSMGSDRAAPFRVRVRSGSPRAARVRTHGDSPARVAWRSTEAQDYAQALSRCVQDRPSVTPPIKYVALLQDDVELNAHMLQLADWIDAISAKRAKTRSWCSLSLFDATAEKEEPRNVSAPLRELRASNMVARVWRVAQASAFAEYALARFDHSPIDWLADEFCRARGPCGKRTYVFLPLPLRHTGHISTLAGQTRA